MNDIQEPISSCLTSPLFKTFHYTVHTNFFSKLFPARSFLVFGIMICMNICTAMATISTKECFLEVKLTAKIPASIPSGRLWTVWAARTEGGRSLSQRLITTARRWLSSWSTLNLSTSTGLSSTCFFLFFSWVSCSYLFLQFGNDAFSPICHLFRALLLELKQMKDLHHDHLTRWVGASLEEGEFV